MLRFSSVSHRHGDQIDPAMDGFCVLPTRPQGNTLVGMGARGLGMMPVLRADGTTLPAAWRGMTTSGTIPMVGLPAGTGTEIGASDRTPFTGNIAEDQGNLSGQFVGGMDRVDGLYLPFTPGAVVVERGTSANLVVIPDETPEPRLEAGSKAEWNAGLATGATTAANSQSSSGSENDNESSSDGYRHAGCNPFSSSFSSIGFTALYQLDQSHAGQRQKAVPRACVRHDADDAGWRPPAGRPPG